MRSVEHLKTLCCLGLHSRERDHGAHASPPCMRSSLTAGRASTFLRWAKLMGVVPRAPGGDLALSRAPHSGARRARPRASVDRSAASSRDRLDSEPERPRLQARGKLIILRDRSAARSRWSPERDDRRRRAHLRRSGAHHAHAAPVPSKPMTSNVYIYCRPWLAQALRPASPAAAAQAYEERPGIAGPSVLSGQLIVTAGGDVVHQTRIPPSICSSLSKKAGNRALQLPAPIQKSSSTASSAHRTAAFVSLPHAGFISVWGPHGRCEKCADTGEARTWRKLAKDPRGGVSSPCRSSSHEHPIAHVHGAHSPDERRHPGTGQRRRQARPGQNETPDRARASALGNRAVADLTRKLYQELSTSTIIGFELGASNLAERDARERTRTNAGPRSEDASRFAREI